MLELQRVSKHYLANNEDVTAVDDFDLTIEAGEFVAIFGPSGSGKTTLLLLAAGLLRPDAGRVLFDGQDVGTMPKDELLEYRRTKLGFVFQNFNLVPGLDAEENVALPLLLRGVRRSEANTQALGALQDVGVSHRAHHLPGALSGGEQQRVAIARALVGQPSFVLADEPTGNLDTERGDAILGLLERCCRERMAGLVLVTHDQRGATRADRTLTMRDGKLVEHDVAGTEP
jgi:ABC-type lipoprotein export system ATPase subunit